MNTSDPAGHPASASDSPTAGITRRTVLTAAAWSAPVIAAGAIAVPAASASGEQAILQVTDFTASWENLPAVLKFRFQVMNRWNDALAWDEQVVVNSLQLYVDVNNDAISDPVAAPTFIEEANPTWAFTGTGIPQPGVTRFSFSWSGTLDTGSASTTTLAWTLPAGDAVIGGDQFETVVTGDLTPLPTHPDTRVMTSNTGPF